MNRLSRSLFRSLLKWNRQAEWINYPFVVSPALLGIEQLLPSGISELEGSEGLQAAAYHCFRHHPPSDANIDIAFKALKALNDHAVILKQNLKLRNSHMHRNPAFRVGQVVIHKIHRVRGVVIGWEITATKQLVHVLPDLSDFNAFIDSTASLPCHLDDTDLGIVSNPMLKRIHNPELDSYFSHLDPDLGQYVPREELAFLYPLNVMDQKYQPRLHSPQAEEAAQRVLDEVCDLHSKLTATIVEHLGMLLCLPVTAHNATDTARQLLAPILTAMSDIMLTKSHRSKLVFKKELVRGRRYHLSSAVDPRLAASVEKIRTLQADIPSSVRTIYEVLSSLDSIVLELNRLIRLRFQTKGYGFPQTLQLRPAARTMVRWLDSGLMQWYVHQKIQGLINKSIEPRPVFTVGTVVRHKFWKYRGAIVGYEIRLPDASRKEYTSLTNGKEQPFYRIVPEESAVKVLGYTPQAGLFVAQEKLEAVSDMCSRIIYNKEFDDCFLGYDVEMGRFRVPTVWKYLYPAGMHAFPEDYPKTSLLQKWINNNANANEDYQQREEVMAFQTMDHLLIGMRDILQSALRRLNSEPNEDSNRVVGSNLSDLLILLKEAPSKRHAAVIESLLQSALAHSSSPTATSALEIGLANMQRGNTGDAYVAFRLAIFADTEFSTPFVGLAKMFCVGKNSFFNNEGSIGYARLRSEDAVYHCPNSPHAQFGLASAYEKLGKHEMAVDSYIALLSLHPWANDASTRLLSLSDTFQVALKALEQYKKVD